MQAIVAIFLVNLSTGHRFIVMMYHPSGEIFVLASIFAAILATSGLLLSIRLVILFPKTPGFHVHAVLLFGSILAAVLLQQLQFGDWKGYLQTVGTLMVAALIAAVVDRIRERNEEATS